MISRHLLVYLSFALAPFVFGQDAGTSNIGSGDATIVTADAFAENEPSLDSGNTAWMITATALVLFMTLPGLALFYGGLVQSKNEIGRAHV